MAWVCISRKWALDNYECEFVCDTEEDVKELPTDCCAGSTAVVAEPFGGYMMNASKEWKPLV